MKVGDSVRCSWYDHVGFTIVGFAGTDWTHIRSSLGGNATVPMNTLRSPMRVRPETAEAVIRLSYKIQYYPTLDDMRVLENRIRDLEEAGGVTQPFKLPWEPTHFSRNDDSPVRVIAMTVENEDGERFVVDPNDWIEYE